MYSSVYSITKQEDDFEQRKIRAISDYYVERPLGKSGSKRVNSTVFNSCSSTAVALFNSVPRVVKEQLTLEGAKRELDKFLSNIPDEPPIKGYGAENSNSLLDWCSCRRSVAHNES